MTESIQPPWEHSSASHKGTLYGREEGKQGCDCPRLGAVRNLQVALNSFESVDGQRGWNAALSEDGAPGVCIREQRAR